MLHRLLIALGLALSLALHVQAEAEPPNAQCLVEPTEKSLMKYSAEYGGETYYFCCAECVDLFKADPTSFLGSSASETDSPVQRNFLQRIFDATWNLGSKSPALSIGVLAITGLLLVRTFVPKARPIIGLSACALVAAAAFGAEALVAHRLHREVRLAKEEEDLIYKVHAATFHEYGHPPVPQRPDLPPQLAATYYRGNDERSEELFNGGYYRTTDFNLDLCDGAGNALDVGDTAVLDDLYFRVRITRAPGTPDFFWEPDRMANIFASRSADKLLGRDGTPVPDAVMMKVVRTMWEWEFRYPLSAFHDPEKPDTLAGIFYQFEKRYQGSDDEHIGARFHYAFQFSLTLSENKLQSGSDIWMGALYRKRDLRIWEIPAHEWLSTDPIPVIEGENTTDPKLLGIEGHLLDKN